VAWQPSHTREQSQRRRGISRCTDRSAGGCADRRTCSTTRVQACGGLDTAEAAPRRCVRWRSRGRRWRGPYGPLDRTTLPFSAVGAAARSRRRAGPGWQRRLRSRASRASALPTPPSYGGEGDAGRGCAGGGILMLRKPCYDKNMQCRHERGKEISYGNARLVTVPGCGKQS